MNILSKLSHLDIAVFIGIMVAFVMMIVVMKFSRISANLLQSLAAGRALTLPIFVVTLVASWYGNVIGATQIAFRHGIYNFFALGACWYISAIVFAYFISNKLVQSDSLSLPEIVGKLHGKTSEKIILMMMVMKTLPLTYIMALSIIITSLFGLDQKIVFLMVGVLGVLISLRTSLKSVIAIDLIQFFSIFIGLGLMVYFCYHKLGGHEYLVQNLPPKHLEVTGDNSVYKLILWFLVAFSTTALSPIFHQRCFAAKSTKVAKLGIVISVIFWMISDILTTLGGLYARSIYTASSDISSTNTHHAFLELITQVLPEGLIGYMMAAIAITSISALDSHIFATKTLVINHCKSYRLLSSPRFSNFIGALIIVITTIIAIKLDGDIEKAWLLFESAFIASVLIPVLLSIYGKKLISSWQFNSVILITFPLVAWSDYYFLSHNSTLNLLGLLFNFSFILMCIVYNKAKNKPIYINS